MLHQEVAHLVNEEQLTHDALLDRLSVIVDAALAERGTLHPPPLPSSAEPQATTGAWSGMFSALSTAGMTLAPTLSGEDIGPEDDTTDARPVLSKDELAALGRSFPSGNPGTHPVQGCDRYVDLGPLGVGGMAEVRRVQDRDLGRTMAMKIIKPALLKNERSLARFIEEAQATSQLQHPGIVPVHELGRLSDGRWYYTMREVQGRPLHQVIQAVHEASTPFSGWSETSDGWSFRRLVDAFHKVCNAVAFAHGQGVLHRDLKPDNIMIGTHGEVLVVDWGLSKVVGRSDLVAELADLDIYQTDLVETDRSKGALHATRVGQVAGTPAYMPPEQARGEVHATDTRSDVYALGVILYEMLCGHRAYEGDMMTVLRAVRAGPPVGVGERATLPLPEELVETCARAMSRDPGERYQSAQGLAGAVQAWLDGSKKREQAMGVVEEAKSRITEAAELRGRADTLKAQGEGLLAGVAGWEPEERKHPCWDLLDEAEETHRQAKLKEIEHEQLLNGALTHAADSPDAHAALTELYLVEHKEAEAQRNKAEIARAELLLGQHQQGLPTDHPLRGQVAAYLKGDGALTLVTDPPGAEVLLHRYVEKHRRLHEVFERSLGNTPITEVKLERGSYLCILRREGHGDVRYPVFIGRQEHWHGRAPGQDDPHPIWLPQTGELGANDCYVPAGWFWSGGDALGPNSLPRRRLWCDGLAVRRFPVTNGQYLLFLDNLVAQGREEEALRFAPRERGGTEGEQGPVIYGRADDGRFILRPDADGDVWELDYPVVMVDLFCAESYAKWEANRTGQRWRLPGELEWEKAARGVDGRFHPWGDGFDPSWCWMADSHQGRAQPAVVDTCPVDATPYGVRGMTGNVHDWCGDVYEKEGVSIFDNRVAAPFGDLHTGSRRVVRGGSWVIGARRCRTAARPWSDPGTRVSLNGFRLFLGPIREP